MFVQFLTLAIVLSATLISNLSFAEVDSTPQIRILRCESNAHDIKSLEIYADLEASFQGDLQNITSIFEFSQHTGEIKTLVRGGICKMDLEKEVLTCNDVVEKGSVVTVSKKTSTLTYRDKSIQFTSCNPN